MGVIRIGFSFGKLFLDTSRHLFRNLRGSKKSRKSVSERRDIPQLQYRNNFGAPKRLPGHCAAVNFLQALKHRLSAGHQTSELIGPKFLFPRHQVDHPEKKQKVPLQNQGHQLQHGLKDSNSSHIPQRADILEGADHGALRPVHPRTH